MEGVLLVIKAWGLTALMLWVHRRFFERVARAEPEFEVWCQRGPLIAALRVAPAQLAPVDAALRASLGKQKRLLATLGGWPWPNYELTLRVSRVGRVLALSVTRAELRKTRAAPVPDLVASLRALLNEHPAAIDDLWLLPDLVYGKRGPSEAPAGWLVLAGDEPRPKLRARDAHPTWLAASEGVSAPAEVRQAADAKLLTLPSEC